MVKFIDKLTDRVGVLSAWMLFTIGVMVTYEVVMRKAFNAPTVWADEMARFFQIWAVYLAGAYVLKNRHLIRVELYSEKLSEKFSRVLDGLSLAIIAAFSLIAVWYGSAIVYESIAQDRHTSTMLGVPKWMTESAIPIAFSLLLLQTIVEAIKLYRNEPSGKTDHSGQADK